MATMTVSWLFSVAFVIAIFWRIENLHLYASPLWTYTAPFTENVGWSQTEASILAEMNAKCGASVVDGSAAFLQTYKLPTVDPFCTCLAAEVSRRLSMPGLSVADAIAQLTTKVAANTPVFGDQRMELQRCRMEMRQHIVSFEDGGIKVSNIAVLGMFWNVFSLLYIWKAMLDMIYEKMMPGSKRNYDGFKNMDWRKWIFVVSDLVFFILTLTYFSIYNNKVEARDLAFGLMVIAYFLVAQGIFLYLDLPHGISTISYMIIVPCAVGIMLGASFQLEGVDYVTTLYTSALIPICLMLMLFMPNFDVTTLSVAVFLIASVIMTANASLVFPGNRGFTQYWFDVDAFWVWLTMWPLVFAPIIYGVNIYGEQSMGEVKIKNKKDDKEAVEVLREYDHKITLTILYCELIPKIVIGVSLMFLMYKYNIPAMPAMP